MNEDEIRDAVRTILDYMEKQGLDLKTQSEVISRVRTSLQSQFGRLGGKEPDYVPNTD